MRRILIMHKNIWLTTALAVVMSFSAIAQKPSLQLHFQNVVNSEPVVLDNATYKNALGQTYTITNLKYYISNIQLISEAGQVLADSGYYLLRQDDTASMTIDLPHIPIGHYSRITFMLGIDSLHNCSGAQSDALDPVNGMFWTWNTGYIFFKLEGKSNASKNPGGIYEYHIGGYKAPANCIRTISMNLENPNQPVKLFSRIETVRINADVAKLMDSVTPLNIAKYSSVTDFHNATMIADRYQHMFYLHDMLYEPPR